MAVIARVEAHVPAAQRKRRVTGVFDLTSSDPAQPVGRALLPRPLPPDTPDWMRRAFHRRARDLDTVATLLTERTVRLDDARVETAVLIDGVAALRHVVRGWNSSGLDGQNAAARARVEFLFLDALSGGSVGALAVLVLECDAFRPEREFWEVALAYWGSSLTWQRPQQPDFPVDMAEFEARLVAVGRLVPRPPVPNWLLFAPFTHPDFPPPTPTPLPARAPTPHPDFSRRRPVSAPTPTPVPRQLIDLAVDQEQQ